MELGLAIGSAPCCGYFHAVPNRWKSFLGAILTQDRPQQRFFCDCSEKELHEVREGCWLAVWLAGWDVNGVKRPNGGPITSRLQAAGWRSGWLAGCWLVGWQAWKDF